jgi:hypothetical protein
MPSLPIQRSSNFLKKISFMIILMMNDCVNKSVVDIQPKKRVYVYVEAVHMYMYISVIQPKLGELGSKFVNEMKVWDDK